MVNDNVGKNIFGLYLMMFPRGKKLFNIISVIVCIPLFYELSLARILIALFVNTMYSLNKYIRTNVSIITINLDRIPGG